MFSAH